MVEPSDYLTRIAHRVSVFVRRRQFRMAEEIADGSDRSAIPEQMTCERMPRRVERAC